MRMRMPSLLSLPRWVRWMEARHGVVSQTAEQLGMGRRCGAAALEKAATGGCRPEASGPTQLRLKRRATLSFFFVEIRKQSADTL